MRQVTERDATSEVNPLFTDDDMAAKCRPRGMYWPLGAELPWLRDAIYQMQRAPKRQQETAIYSVLVALAERGGVARIPVGATPLRDTMIDANLAAIRRGLSAVNGPDGGLSFDVDLWCGKSECDGSVTPSMPVRINPIAPDARAFTVDGPIELEVGQTRPETTLGHLLHAGRVARWAYGSREMIVLAIDPERSLLDEVVGRVLLGGLK